MAENSYLSTRTCGPSQKRYPSTDGHHQSATRYRRQHGTTPSPALVAEILGHTVTWHHQLRLGHLSCLGALRAQATRGDREKQETEERTSDADPCQEIAPVECRVAVLLCQLERTRPSTETQGMKVKPIDGNFLRNLVWRILSILMLVVLNLVLQSV